MIGDYHGFGGAFVGIAISPDSPSNPLSETRLRRLVDATVPLILPMLRVARLPWGNAVVEQVRGALAVAMDRG